MNIEYERPKSHYVLCTLNLCYNWAKLRENGRGRKRKWQKEAQNM